MLHFNQTQETTMSDTKIGEWFKTATLNEVTHHHTRRPARSYDEWAKKSIMREAFLNPDPEVFKFCVQHYSGPTCTKNLHSGEWALAAKKASPEHRAHYVSLFKKMNEKNKKDILYSSIEYKDHEMTQSFMDLSKDISPPHLLRHAVVHRNKKMANILMSAYPQAIAEADQMITHPSYNKIHSYWQQIYALHQKRVLESEIGCVQKTSKKTSKI